MEREKQAVSEASFAPVRDLAGHRYHTDVSNIRSIVAPRLWRENGGPRLLRGVTPGDG